ncbi:MAG: toprim domain-containing protein [Candidatus Aenigmatarchaeota archaeon]
MSETKIQKFLKEIDIYKDKPVIVEGIRDKKVLLELGFENVVAISGNSLIKIADDIVSKFKEVVILTDFDKEGRRMYSFLKKYFEAHHLKVIFLSSLFKSTFKIAKLEELAYFIKFLRNEENSINFYIKSLNRKKVLNKLN